MIKNHDINMYVNWTDKQNTMHCDKKILKILKLSLK